MSRRWFLLAIPFALLLAVAALLRWPSEQAAAPRADSVAGEASTAPDYQDLRRANVDVGATFGRRFEEALTGRQPDGLRAAEAGDPLAGTLRGRLVVRQKPWQELANVEVMLTTCWLDTVLPIELPDADEPLPPLRGPSACTDAQGRFVLTFVPPAGELFFLIGHGSIWSDFQKVERVPHAGETTDLGDVLVDDRGCCSGRLFSAVDGRPLTDVEVRAVDNPLLDPGLDTDELRAGRARDLDYFLAGGFVDGQPVPRWVEQRDRLLPFPRARTDSEGRFVLTGLRQGIHDLFLHGDDADGRIAGVAVAGGVTTDVGAFWLEPGGAQAVQVLHGDGIAPWVGARVTALPRGFGFASEPVVTDADGKATLRGLDPAVDYWLLFQYPEGGGFVPLGRFVADAAPPDAPRQWRIDAPPQIALLLVDEAGQPVADGEVSLLLHTDALRAQDTRLPQWFQPVQDAPGRFRARRAAGEVLALAAAPGKAPAVARVSGDTTTITLLRGVDVCVRCVDRDKHPVAAATVVAQLQPDERRRVAGVQWSALATTRVALGDTDEHGELHLSGLWPTRIAFAAEHPAFVRSPAATVLAVDGLVVPLVLREAAALQGTIHMDVRPVARGMRVQLRSALPTTNELHDSPFLAQRTAVTAADGTFAFRDLLPGYYELRPLQPKQRRDDDLSATQRERYRPLLVAVAEGQQLPVELEATRELAATPTLVGRFRLDGAGVPGALVRVRRVIDADELASWFAIRDPDRRERTLQRYAPERLGPDPWLLRAHTDQFGAYAFEDLEPGKWELRIDAPWQGRLQFVQQTVVEVDEPKHGDAAHFDLDLSTGSVRLWVLGPGQQPLAGRMLELRLQGPPTVANSVLELLTDARGCVELDHVPAGRWLATPTTHGQSFVQPELEVRAREFVDRSFALVD